MLNLLIAIDQLVNVLLAGWPDETLSSRAYRMDGRKRRWSLARRVIDGLFFWQADHCRRAFESERERRHLPPEART
ncbi:hypothetical protein SAMN05216201_10993 [Pseudomonas linyingensis]|uniref:Uncharacterized protein n=1 Tax=Pseudomonas linyingensis TaxID=915471 RepID=A0A1H6ZB08_9PSED|nr:pseudouridine synthase [Pseudomonas linyingensis]SEJ46842.1 hypothetical protein SAMN05216201_10993 [Pseudomonas linyingensis]